jgi:hypothetical protein
MKNRSYSNFVLMFAFLLLLTACSVESKLNRNFKGKPFSEVMGVMGAPSSVENLVGGGTIRSFVKKKMLGKAPINTGRFAYERFDSPKVNLTETTQFFVGQDGMIKEVKYSSEYSR